MRALLLTVFLALAAAAPAQAGAALAGAERELTITFVSADSAGGLVQAAAGGGLLDVGRLSAARTRGRRWPSCGSGERCGPIVQRRVAVRVDEARRGARGARAAHVARLSAFVAGDGTRCRVRVNGMPLTALPQVIDAHAPVGAAIVYTLEIEVPSSEPEGPLASAITWLAETE